MCVCGSVCAAFSILPDKFLDARSGFGITKHWEFAIEEY